MSVLFSAVGPFVTTFEDKNFIAIRRSAFWQHDRIYSLLCRQSVSFNGKKGPKRWFRRPSPSGRGFGWGRIWI